MFRVVVCVSGGGTNLQAIMDAVHDGRIRDTEIAGVISNNADAYALERAHKAGVPGVCIAPKDYRTRAEFHQALLRTIRAMRPDLIVLAGFLVKVPEDVIRAYPGKIINIHPSLIPAFAGKGYYGLKVHEAALARGVKATGATVHFADEEMDNGPIILQKAIPVLDDDTPKTLQQRVMEECEWQILPQAVELIAHGRVVIEGRSTRILPE